MLCVRIVRVGYGWMSTRERHSGLEEDVDAVWLAGWLVQMLTGHGGRGRRSKADTAGTGNRYRGKDGGKVMADMACRS